MPDPADAPDLLDPQALLAWIDEVADRFEAAWAGDTPPELAPFVDGAAGLPRAQLLKELVKIDLEHRWRSGEPRRPEAYLADWPELLGQDGWLPDDLVSFAEDLRRRAGAGGGPGPVSGRPGGGLKTLGRFQLGEELGRGAFGTVYKARDAELDRVVAVKVPRAAFVTLEEQERFQRGARAAALLQHPTIVPVYEVGEAAGVPYIVSEYVPGRTLADLLAEKRLPFRDSAALVVQVARALHYAHGLHVVHRDIKPSNILLDAEGRPRVTDFGLAGRRGVELTLTADGEVLGTPAYMAPEQAAGRHRDVGPLSDVYSLGVLLYRMLTGALPFAGDSPLVLYRVLHEEPPPPRRRDPAVPRDLETVCLKAMAKEPGQRYATAAELADDLQRFLDGEPIHARPAGVLRRLGCWCRRNPRVAVLTGAVLVLLAAAAAGALGLAHSGRVRDRERRREAFVQQLQRLRLTAHRDGWSAQARDVAAEAAALRGDDDLRTQATATLAGLDAHPGPLLATRAVAALAFDPAGRLLLGGRDAGPGGPEEPAGLWDGRGDLRPGTGPAGPGPVAFRRDGTPLQLQVGDGGTLVLHDLAGGAGVRTAPFGRRAGEAAWRVRPNDLDLPVLALAPEGRWLAAALARPGDPGAVVVWRGDSGGELARFPGGATALTFSPDGSLLAAGDEGGGVRLWALPDGKPAGSFHAGRTMIHSLAFSPDAGRLAVGSAGGGVTLCDWRAGRSLPCSGAVYDVYAVAFSPDGGLLASGGRGLVLLWDAATGRLLLGIDAGDWVTAVAFGPDGGRLAVSSGSAGVRVWDVEHGRGVRTLRGLAAPVDRCCFSADGRLLAALAHNWQVAVWDLEAGRLLHVFDAPQGYSSDNAALAFDPDGRRLAFCTGHEAVLWDVATGAEVRAWRDLPPGLVDVLAFPAADRLLLFRAEARDGRTPPLSNFPAEQYPRVGRLRDLLAAGPPGATELPEFNRRVHNATATADGRCFVIEGVQDGPAGRRQLAVAVDGWTGRRLWERGLPKVSTGAWDFLDPTGEFLALSIHADADEIFLLRAATGAEVERLRSSPLALGPGARQVIRVGPARAGARHPGFALLPRDGPSPLVVLGVGDDPMSLPVFDRSGNLLAWGNSDGTVTVCRLDEVRDRLARVGLGW